MGTRRLNRTRGCHVWNGRVLLCFGVACLGLALPGVLFDGASALAQDQFRFGEPSVGQVRDGRIQNGQIRDNRARPSQIHDSPSRVAREPERQRASWDQRSDWRSDSRYGAGSRSSDRFGDSFRSDLDHRSSGGTYRRSAIDPDGDGKGFVYRAPAWDGGHWGNDRHDFYSPSRSQDRYGGSWYDRHTCNDRCGCSRSGTRVSIGTSSRSNWYGGGWNDCDDWSDARWRYDPYCAQWGWQHSNGWYGSRYDHGYGGSYGSAYGTPYGASYGGWQDPWASPGLAHGSQTIVVTDPIVVQEQRTVVVESPGPRRTTVVVARPSAALASEALVRADRGDHVRAATQLREFARAEGRVPASDELDRGARRALDRVIADYERRSTGYEAGADTFFVLGMSYAMRGDYERARAALDTAHAWGDRDAGTRQIRQWLQHR